MKRGERTGPIAVRGRLGGLESDRQAMLEDLKSERGQFVRHVSRGEELPKGRGNPTSKQQACGGRRTGDYDL